ncbi:MAG: hypothetical protein ACTHU0_01435 [Kofleriaceae bacterium]
MSDLAFSIPAAARKGDLLLALVVRNQLVTAPAGWVPVETGLGAGGLFLDTWARLVDDNEPSSARFSSVVLQELQGELVVLRGSAPGVVRESAAHGAFTADTTPDTPAVSSEQAINLVLGVWSASGNVALTAPAGWTTIDAFSTGHSSARSVLFAYRALHATGAAIALQPAGAAAASTGRAFALVLRDRAPVVPVELFDPVPGNIGLLP